MKQLPTRRQMYWILGIALLFTVFSASGGIVSLAGYFTGQVVVLTVILTVGKIIQSGLARLLGNSKQTN